MFLLIIILRQQFTFGHLIVREHKEGAEILVKKHHFGVLLNRNWNGFSIISVIWRGAVSQSTVWELKKFKMIAISQYQKVK